MNIMPRWVLRVGLAILLGGAISAPADERILAFDSRIEVNPDATMTVTETIRVRAERQSIKRGIYRDFPQIYQGEWGLVAKTGFEVVRVLRDGNPEPFHTEKRENGVRVYIGQASVMLPLGNYTYTLTYRTDRQLGFFKDHDELYWNVTGNGWEFPIDRVTAGVRLPAGVDITATEAYTGPQGARDRDYQVEKIADNEVGFVSTRGLSSREGLTIVVSWPKGPIVAPTPRDQWMRRIRENPGIFLAAVGLLLVCIYYLLVWLAVGKDPKRGVIIPLYSPPKGFSPAAVRGLVRMGFDDKSFAAGLINLAVKGAVTVEESNREISELLKKAHAPEIAVKLAAAGEKKTVEYSIRLKNAQAPGLAPEEQVLLDKLLKTRTVVRLVQSSHLTVSAAKKGMESVLTKLLENRYFEKNLGYWVVGLLFSLGPLALSLVGSREIGGAIFALFWLSIWTLVVTFLLSACVSLWRSGPWHKALPSTLFALPFLGGEFLGLFFLTKTASVWVPVFFLVGALMNGFFYHLLKAPTLTGRKILDQIEGFRWYLKVGEKDRLNLENPPQRTPELFEQFLPYALALDVEQEWAEQFADVLAQAGEEDSTYSPTWYSGRSWVALGAVGFTQALGSSMSTAIAAASTAPGSSSGGSGGGGGGGSSGGGGGGGGGGGW
jgi:uncharacterized membrane protein YgcG